MGRIQAAKANDKLEQVTNAQEKPSFDAIYAAKEELERVNAEFLMKRFNVCRCRRRKS